MTSDYFTWLRIISMVILPPKSGIGAAGLESGANSVHWGRGIAKCFDSARGRLHRLHNMPAERRWPHGSSYDDSDSCYSERQEVKHRKTRDAV